MADKADSVASAEAYGAVAEAACKRIRKVLAVRPETQSLDALDLWEWLDPLTPPACADVDPGITLMQWSAALDVARERNGLPPLPRRSEIALIGAMADPNVRGAARILRDGMFVGSELGTSFHCRCGWVSERLESANHLGAEISWHLLDAHR